MDETYYNRKIPRDQQPERKSRLLRLVGYEQWQSRRQRNSFFAAVMRPVVTITKIPVFLTSLYYVFTFAWVIALNAATGFFLQEVYHFGPVASGMYTQLYSPKGFEFSLTRSPALYFFAPMVATILGELAGHWAFDIIAKIYMKRNNGRLEPEARLIPVWFATPLMVLGIVLLGQSLERAWHYMVTAVVWSLYVFGIIICTTSINSYLLDSYPEASGEVAAWINFGRTVGGFIITYFEINWVLAQGAERALGIQAAIVFAASFIIIFLQFFGKRLRLAQGSVNFATD